MRFADVFNVSLDFLVGRKPKSTITADSDDSIIEQDVQSYISTMQIDKYLIDINDNIRNLPEDEKRKVTATVAFIVNNYFEN